MSPSPAASQVAARRKPPITPALSAATHTQRDESMEGVGHAQAGERGTSESPWDGRSSCRFGSCVGLHVIGGATSGARATASRTSIALSVA